MNQLSNVYVATSYEDIYEVKNKFKTTDLNEIIIWIQKELESGREISVDIL